jgi:hypothetical protein
MQKKTSFIFLLPLLVILFMTNTLQASLLIPVNPCELNLAKHKKLTPEKVVYLVQSFGGKAQIFSRTDPETGLQQEVVIAKIPSKSHVTIPNALLLKKAITQISNPTVKKVTAELVKNYVTLLLPDILRELDSFDVPYIASLLNAEIRTKSLKTQEIVQEVDNISSDLFEKIILDEVHVQLGVHQEIVQQYLMHAPGEKQHSKAIRTLTKDQLTSYHSVRYACKLFSLQLVVAIIYGFPFDFLNVSRLLPEDSYTAIAVVNTIQASAFVLGAFAYALNLSRSYNKGIQTPKIDNVINTLEVESYGAKTLKVEDFTGDPLTVLYVPEDLPSFYKEEQVAEIINELKLKGFKETPFDTSKVTQQIFADTDDEKITFDFDGNPVLQSQFEEMKKQEESSKKKK